MYNVLYTKTAKKQLKKMDSQTASFILSFIQEKLVNCTDPRVYGGPLQGNLKSIWRYRVGSYRILARIEDETVTVVIVQVGHRREVYSV